MPPIIAVTATTEVIRDVLRVRVNEAYTRALTEVGLVPFVIPPLPSAAAADAIRAVDGLLLTGGEDLAPDRYGQEAHPTVDVHVGRDESEIALCLAAMAQGIPTLAICRGIQVVNVALGGTLIQDIPSQRPNALDHDPRVERSDRVHDVSVAADSLLAAALEADRLVANSSHHQALDRVADGLRVTACAPDGVIEGAEFTDPRWWMLAVQWHPEELIATPEPWDRNLFAAFARAVHERRG